MCVSLNALWGGSFETAKVVNKRQKDQECLDLMRREVERFCSLNLVVNGVDCSVDQMGKHRAGVASGDRPCSPRGRVFVGMSGVCVVVRLSHQAT